MVVKVSLPGTIFVASAAASLPLNPVGSTFSTFTTQGPVVLPPSSPVLTTLSPIYPIAVSWFRKAIASASAAKAPTRMR